MPTESKPLNWLQNRRAEKLRRELAILQHMDNRLWLKIVGCGSLSIALVAASIFGLGYMAHLQMGLAPAILSSLALAAGLYGVGRYEYGLFWLFTAIFVGVLLAVIFTDLPADVLRTAEFMPDGSPKKPSRKDERKAKLDRAIRRRRQRLEQLLNRLH